MVWFTTSSSSQLRHRWNNFWGSKFAVCLNVFMSVFSIVYVIVSCNRQPQIAELTYHNWSDCSITLFVWTHTEYVFFFFLLMNLIFWAEVDCVQVPTLGDFYTIALCTNLDNWVSSPLPVHPRHRRTQCQVVTNASPVSVTWVINVFKPNFPRMGGFFQNRTRTSARRQWQKSFWKVNVPRFSVIDNFLYLSSCGDSHSSLCLSRLK